MENNEKEVAQSIEQEETTQPIEQNPSHEVEDGENEEEREEEFE